ncbi:CDP-glucose 4,6-dehydratase [Sphingobium fuliginis]|uniref:CDP-glucose 4,6-dehydratase n=1 Tax=Sphingobium fuliginis (strain ATCC 27551) TaxID=336203 RepID=UPI001FCAFC5C|nr:CDP-glucose 4,6-dehydratase [Sphingobium fuliginis]
MENLVNPSARFWSGKKVLLTGHTGFKGAWLYLWLQSLGAQVHGLSLTPETTPNLSVLSGIAADETGSTLGDIRDKALLDRVMEREQPEIVLHLAAQALVRRSYIDPIESFSTNVIGTLQILDAASRCASVQAVLVVTTDKCYENREWLWPYREDEALGGHDPYSASKACAEIATAAWRSSLIDMPAYQCRQRPLAIATARAGNVFGGGDWAVDRLVPDFFRTLAAGQELIIRNPAARRPWQHVLEPLAGYLLLAEHLWDGNAQEAWNFGPPMDDVRPVSYIVDRLFGVENGNRKWRLADGHQPHEANFLALDASKARAQLKWRPRLPLAEALDWTHDWYLRQARNENATELTLEQIARYTARADAAPA